MGNTPVKPSTQALEEKLAELRKDLEEYPDSWMYLESVGRILRCLGDPEAGQYFRRAIANFGWNPRLGDKDPDDNMRLGDLYRLSGDGTAALRCFQRARALYAEAIRERYKWKYPDPSLEIEYMIPASFLASEDEEVADLIERLHALDPDVNLAAYSVARLAAARRGRDAGLAQQAAGEFARIIRRERVPLWVSSGMTPWDWYEIAMEVVVALSGQEEAKPEKLDPEQPQ